MDRDAFIGVLMLVVSIGIIIACIWLVFFPPIDGIDIFVLKLIGAAVVIGVFGILAWIGYTLATTSSTPPEEFGKK